MRCLALAQAWKDAGGGAIFAMAEGMPAIEERVRAEGFDIYNLAAKPGSSEDADLTADLALSQKVCFVVVDGYQFSSEYQICLKQAGLHLLFIDDYGHADSYCADLVLNQNIYAGVELYEREMGGLSCYLDRRLCCCAKSFGRGATRKGSIRLSQARS